jgi:hypothetical protein
VPDLDQTVLTFELRCQNRWREKHAPPFAAEREGQRAVIEFSDNARRDRARLQSVIELPSDC